MKYAGHLYKTRSKVLLGGAENGRPWRSPTPALCLPYWLSGPGVPSALTRRSDPFAERPRSSDASDFRPG